MRIFLSTTDQSGDEHAAALIGAIRALRPEAEFAGLGGPRMAAAGCRLLSDTMHLPALTLHVLRQVNWWRRTLRDTARFWDDWRPDVFVPIDSPGINFPLARRARRRGIHNVYYIPPQIWAWGRWRLPKLRRLFERLLVALPFEEAFYRERRCVVEYVGHPLFDYLPRLPLVPDLKAELGLPSDAPLIGLLPGSRSHEVSWNMPLLRDAALILRERHPEARFAVGAASPALVPLIDQVLVGAAPCGRPVPGDPHDGRPHGAAPTGHLDAPVLVNRTLELMRDARVCLVASGTATLQLVHFATPMVVVYRLPPVELLMLRVFKHSRHIGLVNILAGRELAPEWVLGRDRPDLVAASALPLIEDTPQRAATLDALRALRAQVDQPGAVRRAAEAIVRAGGR